MAILPVDNSPANTGKTSQSRYYALAAPLVAILLLIKMLFSLLAGQQPITRASDLTKDSVAKAVNEQRSTRNLLVLNYNSILAAAAQSKADDMQARHYFSHVDPDGHYIWDKITALGYKPYAELGENLAIEFYDTESLIAAWMNSPTHRANILQEGFRDQGLGINFGDVTNSQYYSAVANTFGTLAAVPQAKATTAAKTASSPAKTPAKPAASQTPSPTAPAPVLTTQPSTNSASNTTPSSLPVVTPRGPATQASSSDQSLIATATPNQNNSTSTPLNIPPSLSASGLAGLQTPQTYDSYQINRYLMLIAGVLLLLIMLGDLKVVVEKRLGNLDKKANNLVMLALSIIVIAFLYWF